jgi:hypothetical protein
MPLVVLLLTSLFPNSDLLGWVAIAGLAYLTLPFFAKREIKEAMGNQDLKWPYISLNRATRLCLVAGLLFAFQYVLNLMSANAIDIFGWGGLAVGLLAIFYTALVVEYVLKPNSKPPITFSFIMLVVFWVLFDYLAINGSLQFSPEFGTNVGETGFILLVFPSIVSSLVNVYVDWKSIGDDVGKLSFICGFLPYFWLLPIRIAQFLLK